MTRELPDRRLPGTMHLGIEAASERVFARVCDVPVVPRPHFARTVEPSVLIDSLSGPLYAIDASTGEQLWTSSSGEPPPTVVDAVVYLDRSYYTYVLDTSAGEEQRTTYTWGISFLSSVVQDGVVYIPVDYGEVFGDVLALDASTGELRWRYLMGRPPSHLEVVGGVVYVSLNNGDVYALDAEISVPPEESAPLVSSSEPPLGSCYDGLLSTEPMHCYLLEQAEVAGFIDVEAIYNGGGNLYIYIRQAERPGPETAAFFRERAIEFYLQWPSVAPRDTTKYWECRGTYEWCLAASQRGGHPRIVALPIFRAKLIEGPPLAEWV